MRMHDRLMIETPQPAGADSPFTLYAETFGDAQVIDATDVAALLYEMERLVLDERNATNPDDVHVETWLAERFCDFDWSALTMNMPPFPTFVMEFDLEEAMHRSRQNDPHYKTRADSRNMGQALMAVTVTSREDYMAIIGGALSEYDQDVKDVFAALMHDADIKWVYCMSVFLQMPMRPIAGPMLGFTLPVRSDGSLFLKADGEPMSLVAPPDPLRGESVSDRLIMASKLMYMTVVPTLMAINFMHTPQGDRGYHRRIEHRPTKRDQKHYQRKNFRPLTSWHVLDISPLREQFERTLGRTPRSPNEFAKAMHVVRGNTATYAPNTYFGRKHDEPISVFRPAHRRGDIKAGRIDKDYHLDTGT